MAALISTRADEASQLLPNVKPGAVDTHLARADGLTEDEAAQLAKWLTAEGYGSIEVLHEADHACVVWRP
jgi:hypothetical protein